MKIYSLVFDDEITIWWQRKKKKSVSIYLDNEKIGETDRTHFSFTGLQSDKKYIISVDKKDEITVKTLKKKRRINVAEEPFFAVGDGKTLNTKALQKAIDVCDKGACIYFPDGIYLTGALDIKSDTEIFLEKGAVLQGTCNADDYLPKIKSRFEGKEQECYRSLLNVGILNRNGGYSCKNVYIRGGGSIIGGGKPLCDDMTEKERERIKEYLLNNANYIKTCEDVDTVPGRARGRLIGVNNGENVVISNVVLKDGPSWNLHFVYSKDIVTYGCKIVSKGIKNGDGWDPDSSENCVLFDTVFDTSDDCVAIKSGKNPEGNIINRPCKNIYIFDCVALCGHGMSIGSEMSGGVENVYVWDCDFRKTIHGLQVKGTSKRGGYVKNVVVQDCLLSCIKIWSVGYNDDGESAGHPPIFSRYHFENVVVDGGYFEGEKHYVILRGFDEIGYEISNVTFKNVKFEDVDKSDAVKVERVKNFVWEE